jgi:urease accessory protein
MNSHWKIAGLETADRSHRSRAENIGRFDLTFRRHGCRTAVGRQFVSYPFHFTRPFNLDAAIPSLATVYQQSSSGGLYRADRLSCRYEVEAEAAAHITTQAATIVHDCHGQPARQDIDIALGERAFLAITPDPTVLFPGAALINKVTVNLKRGSVLLLADTFAIHDPHGQARSFDELDSDVLVRDQACRILVRDSFRLKGSALCGPTSPMGRWRVFSSFLLVGDLHCLPHSDELVGLSRDLGAVTGVTPLAHDGGWGVRCLAADAIAARGVAERVFGAAVHAAFGSKPSLRRK